MSKIVRFSAIAAATMILAACNGTDTAETTDDTTVEGAADETMGAADAAGDAMTPAEETEAAVDAAVDQAEEAADATAAAADEAEAAVDAQ